MSKTRAIKSSKKTSEDLASTGKRSRVLKEKSPVKKSKITVAPKVESSSEAKTERKVISSVPIVVKKKKRRQKDPAWSSKKENRRGVDSSGKQNPEALLKSWRKVPEVPEDVKTSVAISKEILAGKSPRTKKRFLTDLEKKCKENNPHHTPLARITKKSEHGTPIEGESRSGRSMYSVSSVGSMSFFSSQPPIHSPNRLVVSSVTEEEAEKIRATSTFQLIKSVPKEDGGVKAFITKELVAASAKQIRKNEGKRVMSQNAVVAKDTKDAKDTSAAKYGELFIKEEELLTREWLHFIMHQLLANAAQVAENIGCGSFHANTEMLHFEFQYPLVKDAYPEGYWVECVPHYVEGLPGNRMLTYLEYTLKTDDFILPMIFNCQVKIPPLLTNHLYFKAFVEAAIGLRDKFPDEPEIDTGISLEEASGVLFTPPPPRFKKDEKEEKSSSLSSLATPPRSKGKSKS